MPAKIVPTDSQVKQLNLDRLTSIFNLPPEYLVRICCSQEIPVDNASLWNTTYVVTIGKSPKQVSVPDNSKHGWFSKKYFKTVTRYTRVARVFISPYHSPERSSIKLTGNETENSLIHTMLEKASREWVFEKGETEDITLEINIFPESEDNYFDIEYNTTPSTRRAFFILNPPLEEIGYIHK